MSMTFSHTNFAHVHQLLTLNMMNRQLCLPSTDIYKILIQIQKEMFEQKCNIVLNFIGMQANPFGATSFHQLATSSTAAKNPCPKLKRHPS